jgi:BirA family biotin operon repressor/biotin-[acetyl-CoA-carboxylase] ligase
MSHEVKPELLNANAIAGALDSGYWRVSVIDEIDSTQNYLRTSNPKSGDLITAEYQSAGRGRLDRSFVATKSTALLFSFYVEPKIKIEELGFLPLLVGFSVAQTINELTQSQDFFCKWPNDILYKDLKIAGVLAEKFGAGVIVGVGINVSTTADQLPVAHASSIFLVTERILDRNLLLAKILRNLLVELSTWESGRDMTSAYRKMNATLGKAVRIELPGGESIEAIAQDIDSTGALHLNSGQIITVGDVIHLDSKLS